jgi:chaperonin GroES
MSNPKPASEKIGARPLGKRVIVAPIEVDLMSEGGVMLPETMRHKPDEAQVVAIGDHEDIQVSVGDLVHLPSFCGTPINVDEVLYRVVSYDDIIAVML